eukprot:TRINITY_DN1292_c0_g1_i12.p1 TRINITY_DN1292_c0_g1~~TRINITY_DN1292_c0_g1_i12.p1  ORF type:complete len:293 (+),score=-18.24 TRINITY_DN1292_c0_g1_i12:27-905(+)
MSLFFFFFFFQNVLSYEQYQRMCKQLSHNNQIKFTHTHYLNDTLDFKAYPLKNSIATPFYQLINITPKTTTKILKLLHIFFTINIHSNESKKIYKKFPSAGFPLIEESKGTLFEKHTVNIIAVLYPNKFLIEFTGFCLMRILRNSISHSFHRIESVVATQKVKKPHSNSNKNLNIFCYKVGPFFFIFYCVKNNVHICEAILTGTCVQGKEWGFNNCRYKTTQSICQKINQAFSRISQQYFLDFLYYLWSTMTSYKNRFIDKKSYDASLQKYNSYRAIFYTGFKKILIVMYTK